MMANMNELSNEGLYKSEAPEERHLGADGVFSDHIETKSEGTLLNLQSELLAADTSDAALSRLIDGWRRKLLDTGKRNRMINYRESSRSTLRILEPDASTLFHRLVSSDKPLSFQKPISKHTDLRTYAVISLMESLSYTLNVQNGDIKTDGTVMEREKTLRNLRAKAKLALEEQGTNILYLCFGFVRWKENSKSTSPWIESPLLMMPVSLGLKNINAPYTLSRLDDDIEVNPTLDYLFNSEYQIDLPTFVLKEKDKACLDAYFSVVEEIVNKQGWALKRNVSLGLFSFLKISMYHDLTNNKGLMMGHPVLRAMAGDPLALPPLPTEIANYDYDRVKPGEWHEVVDSDSSQEEAILLSKKGVSFVLQGPPGTGKSQTITNIIAEAIGDGKKVLFVSEKAAALQVVLKRLAETDLDDFCLSLHNYKANKKEIIHSIGANLSLKEQNDTEDSLRVLTELFNDRQFLNQYARELHQKLQPLNKSAYEVFGNLAKLSSASTVDYHLEDAAAVTMQEFAQMQYCVADFEKALHEIGTPLHDNPWYGTTATAATQAYKRLLEQQTSGLSEDLRTIKESSEPLAAFLKLPASSFQDVQILMKTALILENRPAFVSQDWTDLNRLLAAQTLLSEAKLHAVRLHTNQNELLSAWHPSAINQDISAIGQLTCEPLSGICSGSSSVYSILCTFFSNIKELLQDCSKTTVAYRNGSSLIAYKQDDSIDNILALDQIIRKVAYAPVLEATWFDVKKNESYTPLIEEAAAHSASFNYLTGQILQQWDHNALRLDADAILRRFKADYSGVFRKLSSDYKQDMRSIKACAKNVGTKIDDAIAIDLLQKISARNNELSWLVSNAGLLTEFLGGQFRGATSNWTLIQAGMHISKEISCLFPYSSVPQETASALSKITSDSELSARARQIADSFAGTKAETIMGRLHDIMRPISAQQGQSLSGDVIPQLKHYLGVCDETLKLLVLLQPMKINGAVTYTDLISLYDHSNSLRKEKTWFDENSTLLQQVFQQAYTGPSSNWEELASGINTMSQLNELFPNAVPKTVLELACGAQPDKSTLAALSSNAERLIGQAAPKLSAFDAQFDGAALVSRPIEQVADRYDACMNDFLSLSKWLDYVEARAECDRLGLEDFTKKIAVMDNCIYDVKDAFERGFYISWLNWKLALIPSVRAFRRRIYEQRAKRFAELDVQQCVVSRNAIRAKIINTFPDQNSIAGPGSELSILRHQMSLKQRHMPIRKLLHSIPNLLLTLKPCLMMSPLSVAYFLDAKDYQFDMVVFDEASQIFPQDAIGAIFRAKQVIIAGDTKQLPPTNFFASNIGSQEDNFDNENIEEEPVFDSILEQTENILPNRPLLWHYRSRHEHLIAFSNHEIYGDQLITFPSSSANEPDTGVNFVYVEDGYYEPSPKNHNLPEARKIASLVEQHIQRHPERSLGIIAFSEKQQQAIVNEIQQLRTAHPEYETFFAEGKEDEFFVKNLENVQGDERDTIFFSIGYAKTKEQKAKNRPMSLRFGPLGTSGGERRLNVAITRAKINIKLVSSIQYSDIDETRTDSAGILMLQAYLRFAKEGDLALAAGQRNHVQDGFVDAIAGYIRDNGYSVRTYVGCSGFKLDIAVCDPADPDARYLAGILCDGYSYVSAKTARDRDRLRSTVLKRMGWNLYRVWSCEWINNPEVEGKKLLDFLAKAVEKADWHA